MRRMAPGLMMLLAVCLLAACLSHSPVASDSSSGSQYEASPADSFAGEPAFPASEPKTAGEATLLAAGDIMAHTPQLPAYYDPATNRYDFSPWFREVAPLFRQGDWVIANLETPLAGAELKYTGFPRFNAPAEVADALKGAGVGLVSTANNHAMDRGFAGIARTLGNVRAAGLIPVGTAASEEEAGRAVIIERGGIRMGFLAYTYGTNGLPVPKDKLFAVKLIDRKNMADDIARLRRAGADAVTVSLHFGTEYQQMPNEGQIETARYAVAAGADLVLGSHPHIVQPYDVVKVPAGESLSGRERSGVVIYSLGNFISNQTGNGKDVGLIFGVHLVKKSGEGGETSVTWDRIELTPTWVHIRKSNGKRLYTVLPLKQSLASRDLPFLTSAEYDKMKTLLSDFERRLTAFSPELPAIIR